MSNNHELIAAELELLAGEAQLGRGVSAERACLEGSRILRRRRAIGTTGGVGATGLALVIAVALLPTHGSGGNSGGAGTASGPGDAFAVPTGSAPDTTGQIVLTPATGANGSDSGFGDNSSSSSPGSSHWTDPLVGSATFGWLPTGFTVNGYNDNPAQAEAGVGPGADTYSAVYEISARTSDGSGQADLAVFPVGVSPLNAGQAGLSAAPAVNGKTAYWQAEPGDQAPATGEVVLDWQYTPSTWAELSVVLGGTPQAQARSTVVQMAQQVRFGQAKPVPLPFKHVAAPAGLTTVTGGWQQVTAAAGAGSLWEETLSFANEPKPVNSTAGGYSDLEIGLTTTGQPGAATGFSDATSETPQTSNTTIDGHGATIATSPGYTLVTVDGVAGYGAVELQGIGAEATALAAPGAAAALFRRLDLLGPAQSDWTTEVVG